MSVGNVVSLLGAMRKASSPLAKAKLLALTVRGVRQLSAAERRELVSRLGVEKADWLADRLGEESNETTAEVVRELIKQAGKTDPDRWQELAAKLRDPDERRRLLAEGLEMLDELPADEEPTTTDEAPPPPLADTAPVPSTPAVPKPPPPGKTAPAKPPSKPKPSAPTVAAPARPTAAPKKPVPPALKAPTLRPARFTAPAQARPTKDRALAEALSRALVEELGQSPSLVRRFRLLREKAEETGGWSPEALRVLVELFPDGWARRRALSILIAAGAPADFEAALGLVTETLTSPTDRRWCLGVLATGRDLTPHQREALLTSLESPSWRRRLSKRLAASPTG